MITVHRLLYITIALLSISSNLAAFLEQDVSYREYPTKIPKLQFFKTECSHRVEKNKNCVCKTLKDIRGRLACQDPIPITNHDINKRQGFTIKKPGYYCVAEELVWKPRTGGKIAITVESSDVVIDLRNFTLKQDPQSNTSNNIGIQVAPNLQNIAIANGTIQGFSTLGLRIFEGVDVLLLKDLNVLNNGGRGTVNDYPHTANSGVVLLDVENVQFDIAGGCEIRGLPDNPVKNATITHCNFNENDSTAICFGLFGGFLQDSFVYDCNFSNNTSVLYTSGSGFSFPNNVDYYNNHGSYNFASAPIDFANGLPRAFGISAWSPQGFRVDRCLFYGSHAAFEAGGLDSDPGSITGKNGTYFPFQGFVVTNCISDSHFVSNDSGDTGFAHAFNFKQVSLVKNCLASNIYNLGPVNPNNIVESSLGFILRDPLGGVVEDCHAMNIGEPIIKGEQIVSTSTSVGFLLLSVPGQIANNIVRKPFIFRNCTSQNCTTTGGLYAIGFGERFPDFISFDLPGIIFDNCIAENNRAANGTGGLGFGITHMSGTIIRNSISRGNNVGFQFDNQAGAFNTPPSNRSVIEKNIASNNTSAGFLDDPTNKNVYKNNEADNNGPTPATTNYIGMPTGTSIVTWNLAAGNPPPAQVTAYDNLSVIQAPGPTFSYPAPSRDARSKHY